MSRLKVLVFLAVFLFCVLGSRGSTALYDQWVLEGSTIKISNDEIYRTALDSEWQKLFISSEADSFILENNSCKFSAYRKICFYGARFDIDKNYGRFDYLTLRKIPEIHVYIEDISPKVSVKQSIDRTLIPLNTDATLTVTISNTGTESASYLEFSEAFPEGVIATTSSSNVNIEPNRFTIKIPSLFNEEKKFTISLRQILPVNFTLNGNLSYTFSNRKYTVAVSPLTITAAAPPSVGVEATLSKTPLIIGKAVTLSVNISNPTKADARVRSLIIEIPEGISISGVPEETILNLNRVVWNGILAVNQSKILVINLLPYNSGTYSINISANGETVDEATSIYMAFTQTQPLTITAPLSRITPSISFMLNRKTLKSGQLSNAKIYLKNPDTEIAFFDISYQINSELFNRTEGTVEFLPSNTESQILFQEFVTPAQNTTRIYYVNLTVRYRTAYNEFFNETLSDYIEVKPEEEEKVIEIIQTLPQEIGWNESGIVTVDIQNLQTKAVSGTEVSDLHEGAIISSGSDSMVLGQLNPNEKMTAYTYRFMPENYSNSTSIIIQTRVTFMYEANTYTIYKEGSIEVKRPLNISNVSISPEIEVNISKETVPQTKETGAKDTIQSRKKPLKAGIVERLIGFVTNFFEKIF